MGDCDEQVTAAGDALAAAGAGAALGAPVLCVARPPGFDAVPDYGLGGFLRGTKVPELVAAADAADGAFKVPTLRNVELTYPYFHDGAADTLGEAVDVMGRLQLGKKFSADENAKIVAFLKTLTGDQPKFELPILPPSSDTTPRPTPFAKK